MTRIAAEYAMEQGSMVVVDGSVFKWRKVKGGIQRTNKHNLSNTKGWINVYFIRMSKQGWDIFYNSQIPRF